MKLNQFDRRDLSVVRINTNQKPRQQGIGGLQVMSLHEFEHEHVALVKWPANEVFQPHKHFGGEENYVIKCIFEDEHGKYPEGTCLGSPNMSQHFPFVKEETVIFVKTGHLPVEH